MEVDIEHVNVDEILIDGKSQGDIGDLVLKDREMLGENDYNEIKMQLRANTVYKSAEASINKNLDKFNEIAAKYDKY